MEEKPFCFPIVYSHLFTVIPDTDECIWIESINKIKQRFSLSLYDFIYHVLENIDGYGIEDENHLIENFCINYMKSKNQTYFPLHDINGKTANFWDSVYLNHEEHEYLTFVMVRISAILLRYLNPTFNYQLKIIELPFLKDKLNDELITVGVTHDQHTDP